MATVKFAQMSTNKLTALLETATDEDKVAIQAILDSRNNTAAAKDAELTPEEKQAIDDAENAAEAPAAENEAKEEKKTRKVSPKLTDEELETKHAEAKADVAHRCSVVLPGTAMRVNGTIVSLLKDKRAMQVYYQIVTDADAELDIESCKIYKKVGSDDVMVLPEIVELRKKQNCKARVAKRMAETGEWDAIVEAIYKEASANTGKQVDLGEGRIGRIVGLLKDKRSCGIYYRVEFTDELGNKKLSHRVINYTKDELGTVTLTPVQGMAEELDEEGQALNAAYQERSSREPRKVLTPEEKVLACEEAVKKAEQSLEKAQETLTCRESALELARAELRNKQEAAAQKAAEEVEELS